MSLYQKGLEFFFSRTNQQICRLTAMSGSFLLFAVVLGKGSVSHAGAWEWVRSLISKIPIEKNVDLYNESLMEGKANPIFSCGKSIKPSFVQGSYLLINQCKADLNTNPLLNQLAGTPFGFGVHAGGSVVFVRQEDSQSQALKRIGKDIKSAFTEGNIFNIHKLKFPNKAKTALEVMEPGDLVVFSTQLDIGFSLSKIKQILGEDQNQAELSKLEQLSNQASAGIGVVASGQYLVNIYRLKEDINDKEHARFRVKFISNIGRSKYLNVASIVVPLSPIKWTGISFLNKQINNKIEGLNPFNYGISNSHNDIFVIDYVFDLKNPKSAAIYEELLRPRKMIKSAKYVGESLKKTFTTIAPEKIEDLDALDFAAAEEIAQSEIQQGIPVKQRSVNRIFLGESSADREANFFSINLLLLKIQLLKDQYEVDLVLRSNQDNKKKYYRYTSLSKTIDFKVALDLFNSRKHMSSFDLVTELGPQEAELNPAFAEINPQVTKQNTHLVPKRLTSFSFVWEKKMSDLSRDKYNKLQNEIANIYPLANIKWPAYASEGTATNGFLRAEFIVVLDKLNEYLSTLTEEDVNQGVREYFKNAGFPTVDNSVEKASYCDQEGSRVCPADERYEKDVQIIVKYLHQFLNSNYSPVDRYARFKDLGQIPLFRDSVHGLIGNVLPRQMVLNSARFKVDFNARNIQPAISVVWPDIRPGEDRTEDTVRNEVDYHRRSQDGNYDLRLYEINGEYYSSPVPMKSGSARIIQ